MRAVRIAPSNAATAPRVLRHGELRGGCASWLPTACLLALTVGLSGCRDSSAVQTAYGHRRGEAGKSVNGTRVLSDMFDAAGFRVYTWKYLSSRLDGFDAILWAPDDFELPTQEVRDYFDKWLASADPKTLVYIGRDYDAAVAYWDDIWASAPADQRLEIWRRRARAAGQHATQRLNLPKDPDAACEWFTVLRDEPPRVARELSGPWADGIDAARTDIRVQGLLQPPSEAELKKLLNVQADDYAEIAYFRTPTFEVLLSDGDRPLVTRVTKPGWGNSQILVVANGSFLLNMPLVNHEHRKLAGRLVEACRPGKKVAFLETSAGGPTVSDTGEQAPPADAMRRRVVLAAHWFVLGLVYCFAVFPIFGRPKPLSNESTSEFSQHVDALGELLEETRDVAFAHNQLAHYMPVSRREGAQDAARKADHSGPGSSTDQAPSAKSDNPT